ncbi:metallophosphoesterase family protein [Acaryochloris thomasi]|nr:DNA repair exonuclease [Acaryochloris thomasi]
MARFLHLADVHLGYSKYDNPERTKDFFYAFQDALDRYAIQEQVDFVLIAGDLFEQRQILPAVLNQAQICLNQLAEANIPVLAIEGNHDYEPYGSRTSWLRYLSSWEKLILLKPDNEETLEPWDFDNKRGSYIDLDCGVRVVGSRWYGATAPLAIAKLAASIEQLPPGPDTTVMMFHHGLENYVARYKGSLRYQDFAPLKEAGVDYLALGHIHQNYAVEGWIFNPGSTEANSVIENQEQNPRGVYLVELSADGIEADLKRDYRQRSIVRLTCKVKPHQTPEEVEQLAINEVTHAAKQGQTADTITELRIQGSIGFNRSDVDVRALRNQLQEISEALVFLLKYDVTGREYHTLAIDDQQPPSRKEIERSIFADMLSENTRYRDQAEELSEGLIDLKDRVLQQQSDEDLYTFASQLIEPAAADRNN